MQWTPFHTIGVEPWFPQDLADHAAEVNGRIETLLGNRERCQQAATEGRGEKVAQFNFDNALGVNMFRVMLVDVLQQELLLRAELGKLLGEFYPALAAEAQASFERHQAAEARIKKALETLGYHPFSTQMDPNRWMPGWVAAHPDVFAARQYSQGMRSRTSTNDLVNANDRAIQNVTEELERIRSQVIPV